ncbi:hypothetical protein [Brevibacillus agri]|uniref:hypothetical protein n=2 Tax=Brevibacillus TaxID=55080 RepID=UPI003D9A5141
MQLGDSIFYRSTNGCATRFAKSLSRLRFVSENSAKFPGWGCAINLNYIKVVFSKEVDKESAQNPDNYFLDGVKLTSADELSLQADKKTLYITLNSALTQGDKAFLDVKGAIYSADKLKTVPAFQQEVTFADVTAPTVASVEADGNKVVVVTFAEPVKITDAFVNAVSSNFKLDGQGLSNFAFDKAEVLDATDSGYATTLQLAFAEPLAAGSHKLTVPAGTADDLVDAAGFKVAKSEVSFTVDAVTDAPKVSAVTGENNGTVYVTFDRAMSNSAVVGANYVIGTDEAEASFVSGTGYKKVKLVFDAGTVAKGANVLVVKAKEIKDTFGNVVGTEDLRLTFNATEDTVKPTVTNVTLVDSATVRVKFSEVVDAVFAKNKANYTLKDASGNTITDFSVNQVGTGANSDTYELKLATGHELNGSKYTLKIKNVQDLAASPNVMDEHTATITGTDTVAPNAKEAVQVSDQKVVVYFDETMQSESISNKANFAFKDGTGKFRALPAGATVTPGDGNKNVLITFPTSYKVNPTTGNTEFDVTGIRVSNVKDAAGNVLDGIAKELTIEASASSKPKLVNDSFVLKASGSKVVAEFEYNDTVTELVKADFKVAGQEADTAYVAGKKVVLTFSSDDKVSAIKAAGPNAELTVVGTPQSKNAYGVPVTGSDTQPLADDQVAPTLDDANTAVVDPEADTITLSFSENIDDSITGLYKDDFTFVNQSTGKVLSVKAVAVDGRKITFHFNAAAKEDLIKAGNSIVVKAVTSKIDIKDLEDAAGDQNKYVPTTRDTNGSYVVKAPGQVTPPAGGGTGTDNGAGTGTDNGAGTGTDNGAGTGTDNGAGTGTDNGAGTGTDNGAGTGTDNGAGTGTDNGAGTGTEGTTTP